MTCLVITLNSHLHDMTSIEHYFNQSTTSLSVTSLRCNVMWMTVIHWCMNRVGPFQVHLRQVVVECKYYCIFQHNFSIVLDHNNHSTHTHTHTHINYCKHIYFRGNWFSWKYLPCKYSKNKLFAKLNKITVLLLWSILLTSACSFMFFGLWIYSDITVLHLIVTLKTTRFTETSHYCILQSQWKQQDLQRHHSTASYSHTDNNEIYRDITVLHLIVTLKTTRFTVTSQDCILQSHWKQWDLQWHHSTASYSHTENNKIYRDITLLHLIVTMKTTRFTETSQYCIL